MSQMHTDKTIAGVPGGGPDAGSGRLSDRVFLFVFLALIALNILYPETIMKHSLQVAGITVTPLVVMLPLVAATFAWFLLYRYRELDLRLFDLFFLLMLAYTAVRVIPAAESKIELRQAIEYFVFGAVAYYGAGLLFRRQEYARHFLRLITVSLLAVSVYEIFTYILQSDPVYGPLLPQKNEEFFRGGSTFAQPVHLGAFLLLAAPLAVWEAVAEQGRRMRLVARLAIAMAVMAAMFSFTKSLWILGALEAAVILYYLRRSVNRKVIYLALAAVMLTLSFLAVRGDLSFHLFERRESFWMREWQWGRAVDISKENPVFGVGLFRGIVEINKGANDPTGRVYPVDNYYLTVLLEQGLVGVILYGAALIALMIANVLFFLRAPPGRRLMPLMLTLSLAALLADAFIFDALIVWSHFILFWTVAGLARAAASRGAHLTGV